MPGKVAIVTGGSRGIGRGIALALGGRGWRVVVNYAQSAAAAREVVKAIEKSGGAGRAVQADISLAADRKRLVAETVRAFGRIDLLVNNAGVAPAVRADILEAGEESFDRVLGINLKGPYFLTQLVAREMVREKQGARSKKQEARSKKQEGCGRAIVTISSVSAYTASVNRGDYCVAKAGLGMLTKLFAVRLAEHGINVYEIRPGIIATDMTGPVRAKYDALIAGGLMPIKRWGAPGDVAQAVLAVAEGRLPYSTGQVLDVDGGFHLRWL